MAVQDQQKQHLVFDARRGKLENGGIQHSKWTKKGSKLIRELKNTNWWQCVPHCWFRYFKQHRSQIVVLARALKKSCNFVKVCCHLWHPARHCQKFHDINGKVSKKTMTYPPQWKQDNNSAICCLDCFISHMSAELLFVIFLASPQSSDGCSITSVMKEHLSPNGN